MTCDECKYFKITKQASTIGLCEFPLPDWLVPRVGGSNWVHVMETRQCTTFVSKKEVV